MFAHIRFIRVLAMLAAGCVGFGVASGAGDSPRHLGTRLLIPDNPHSIATIVTSNGDAIQVRVVTLADARPLRALVDEQPDPAQPARIATTLIHDGEAIEINIVEAGFHTVHVVVGERSRVRVEWLVNGELPFTDDVELEWALEGESVHQPGTADVSASADTVCAYSGVPIVELWVRVDLDSVRTSPPNYGLQIVHESPGGGRHERPGTEGGDPAGDPWDNTGDE